MGGHRSSEKRLGVLAVLIVDLVNEGRKVLLNLAKGGRLAADHAEEGALVGGANVRPLELKLT
ncbi:hypothetical protein TYRP_020359 [Tyrophagus putrescentiae]|nr:hypothetical protein TYRP_020359 [Tyrophagus putrescentiae]